MFFSAQQPDQLSRLGAPPLSCGALRPEVQHDYILGGLAKVNHKASWEFPAEVPEGP